MSIVSKVFSPADVFQGPAEIYLGVTPPVSAVPPVAGTNTITLDGYGQPTIGSKGQIATVSVGTGGTGYSVGDTLTVIQSGAFAGLVRVTAAAGGVVSAVVVINGGQGYSVASGLATIGGLGSGCTITIATITAGFHLGLTQGPVAINITPKFNEIKADQFSAPVDAAFVSNACEIDFIIKETALNQIQQFFSGLYSATYWNLVAGGTNPACDFLQIGSTPSSIAKTTSLLLVGTRRDQSNKYIYALSYKAYPKSAVTLGPVQRKKETEIKMKFGMILDPTRVVSDMTMQVVRTPI